MKKLSLLFLLPILIFSCSSDDNEPKQDYTSFTFEHHEPTILKECIAAYLDNKNHYVKIDYLGNLGQNDVSKEVILTNKQITKIYLFTINTRLNSVYTLQVNKKNKIVIDKNTGGVEIEDKTDATQYPQ